MLLHARMPLTAMLARATRGGPVRLIDHGQSAGHDHSLGVTTKAVVPSMAAATPTCAKTRTARLRGVTIIEFEHAAEALTALERA